MTVEMQVVSRPGEKFTSAFEVSEERDTAGAGNWILTPKAVKSIAVQLAFPGGGSGYVEATVDRLEIVKAGTPDAVVWPAGTVSETTQAILVAATAFRLVNVSGTVRISARAN